MLLTNWRQRVPRHRHAMQSRLVNRALSIGLVSLTTTLRLCGSSSAIACPNIEEFVHSKIVISELTAGATDQVSQSRIADSVQRAVSQVTANLSSFDKVQDVALILSLDNPLKMDASDLDSSCVNQLDGRHALIVTWGDIRTKQKNNNIMADGIVVYFMIPTPASYPKWSSYAQIKWGYKKNSASMEEAITDIFSEGHRLEILAAVAIGIVEHANNNNPAAQREFCHAITLLSRDKLRGSAWEAIGLHPQELLGAIEHLEQENFIKMSQNYKAVAGKDTNSSSNDGVCPTP